MKVILLQKIPGLGKIDEVKEVAEGYARNFLFPRHLAIQASEKSLDSLQAHQKKIAKQAEHDLHEHEALAAKLDGFEIEMSEKATEDGVLYAAVTPQKMCLALEKFGLTVRKEQISTKPLKKAGTHLVYCKFPHGLEAEFTVIINGVQAKISK